MNNTKKQIMDAMAFRHACKVFDPNRKISGDDINTILEVGRLSPSSFGFEPWKFLVIENQEVLKKLHPVSWGAKTQFPTASHVVIILARKQLDMAAGSDYVLDVMKDVQKLPEDVQKMKNDFYKAFQENDFDLTDDRKMFDWSSKQTYIALANMMTAAAFMKIDSCPMEGFDRNKFEQILVREGLMDDQHFGVSVMVAFGYREKNKEIREKTRGHASNIIEWVK